jgi:hypothetical protein
VKKTTVYDKLKNMAIVALRRERMYRNVFKDDVIDNVMIEELDLAIEVAEDEATLRALHRVRAYFSVPGTYLEGEHDQDAEDEVYAIEELMEDVNGRIDQIVAEVTQLKRDLKVASVIG